VALTAVAEARDAARELRTEPRGRCALCGTSGHLLHAGVPDYYFGVPGRWSLRRCDNPDCGLVWQDPMVVGEDLIHAYADYYTGSGGTVDRRNAAAAAFDPMFFWLERLSTRLLGLEPERRRFSSAFLDQRPPGSLLDVGCGNGGFAAKMQSEGWKVRGTDFDPSAAAAAWDTHGITVDLGDLPEIGYANASFDAVTARHVVEHVRDPVAFLAECWRILRPGGHLVYITPNAGSLGHRHFAGRWRGLEQPRHLFLFDATSMRALFRRAGVDTVEVFSSVQGGVYMTRQSYQNSRGVVRRCVDYAAIWWLQFREAALMRRGRHVGEELVAFASKPPEAPPDGAIPVH
jgi:2-polyprenyl-3-methyl-5-hydroxy-6-metoxy-1,4-benzoquinol methylase